MLKMLVEAVMMLMSVEFTLLPSRWFSGSYDCKTKKNIALVCSNDQMFQGHVAVVNSLIVKGENVDATTNVRIICKGSKFVAKLIRWDEKSWGFQIKKSNMFRRFNNSKNRTTTLRFTWPLNLGNLLWWKLFLVMELRFFDDGAEQMKMLMIMLMTIMLMLLMTMLLTMILMRYNHIRCSLSFHQFCSSSNFDRALINKT